MRLAQTLSSEGVAPGSVALPRWLWVGDAAQAAHQLRTANASDVQALVATLGGLRVGPDGVEGTLPFAPLALTADPPARARWTERTAYTAVATLRVRAGAALEFSALERWERLASPPLRRGHVVPEGGAVPSTSTTGCPPPPPPRGGRPRQRTRRSPLNVDSTLMFDSYAAALWTSCHAEYIACASDDTCEPPAPSLLGVVSHATELRLANLLDARCFAPACPRTAHPMQQLLVRCVNPASRGWRACLGESLRKHDGARRVVFDAVLVAVTGLHPCLVPTDRPPWRTRLIAGRIVASALRGDAGSNLLVEHSDLVKEAMRRLLSGLLVDSLAMRNVAVRIGAPIGRLIAPPLDTPARGMLDSMGRFARVAIVIAGGGGGGGPLEQLSTALVASGEGDGDGDGLVTEEDHSATWIGRSKQRAPVSRLLQRAEDCFSAAFKAEFLPFWMRATSCGARPQRLDEAQHEGLHRHNAALAACLSVDEEEALRIHRIVLADPSAPLVTVDGACRAIGLDEVGDVAIEEAGVRALPRLLLYARMAWVCDRIVVVDLGRRARSIHLAAIAWRHLGNRLPTEEELANGATLLEQRVNALPTHITHLCVCTECSRITNCIPPPPSSASTRKCGGGSGDGEFCEIGVSAVTVTRDAVTGEAELYCSKRSSAALRSAIAAETSARTRRVDEDAMMVDPEPGDAIVTIVDGGEGGVAGPSSDAMAAMAHEGSVASRMRRDCKRALEQRCRATLCGEMPLLRVRLVGRAVRIYGMWYSICSFCATFVHVQPHNRIDAEIACLHCCETFRRDRRAPTDDDGSDRPACRFCKKVESGRVRNYVTYHSPKDVSGPNAQRPPPLRTTSWCPAHHRPWLRDALSALSTPQVIAHIAVYARPVSAAATTMMEGVSGLAPAPPPRPRRNIATMRRRAGEVALRKERKERKTQRRVVGASELSGAAIAPPP